MMVELMADQGSQDMMLWLWLDMEKQTAFIGQRKRTRSCIWQRYFDYHI